MDGAELFNEMRIVGCAGYTAYDNSIAHERQASRTVPVMDGDVKKARSRRQPHGRGHLTQTRN
jgi:hypothetical protein